MKTKTDDYLEEILERFDEEFKYLRNKFVHADIGFELTNLKDFISKEFREYAKNLNKDKNNRFHF